MPIKRKRSCLLWRCFLSKFLGSYGQSSGKQKQFSKKCSHKLSFQNKLWQKSGDNMCSLRLNFRIMGISPKVLVKFEYEKRKKNIIRKHFCDLEIPECAFLNSKVRPGYLMCATSILQTHSSAFFFFKNEHTNPCAYKNFLAESARVFF